MNVGWIRNFLLLFIVFFLTGCNIKPQDLSKKEATPAEQQVLNQSILLKQSEAEEAAPLVKETESFEYRFYAPDRSKFIVEQLECGNSPGEPLPVKTRLYYKNSLIDISAYSFGYEYKRNMPHVAWIDNTHVILNGIYILDTERMTKEFIKFHQESLDSQQILNYQLSPAGKMMLYVTIKKPTTDLKRNLNVLLYDIDKGSWKIVYSKEISWRPDWGNNSAINQILWMSDSKVYFDYPVEDKYTQVVQYDLKMDKAIDYDNGFKLFDISPDRKNFIIEKQEVAKNLLEINYYVMEPDTHKTTYKIPSNRYAWSSDNPMELGVITYNTSVSNSSKKITVEIISLLTGKTIKKITDERFNVPKATPILIDFYDHNYILKLGDRSYTIKLNE